MFERFTERARQVVVLAQDEARALNHNYIGTEHLLLGLLREGEGLAARVLESLDVNAEDVRAEVVRIVGQGDEAATGQIPFTTRARKVLELSVRETLSLGDDHVATEHLLLGLIQQTDGVSGQILEALGAAPQAIRDGTIKMLHEPPSEEQLRRARDAKRRRALEAAAVSLTTAKELAIANEEFDQAAQISDIERRLDALLEPPA